MQGHYWLPYFHPLLTTPSRGPTPSSKADSRASDLYSFERALRFPPTSPAFMPWQLRNVPVDYRRNPPVDHSVLQPHNHSHPHASL